MALGEPRKAVNKGNKITEVSWTGGTAQDVYYGIDNSFQYSANINTDDEMHGIKLATRAMHTNDYAKCQLVSLWEHGVMALPVDVHSWDDKNLKRFQCNWYDWSPRWEEFDDQAWTLLSSDYKAVPWVVFQNRFWFGANIVLNSLSLNKWYLHSVPLAVNAPGHWVSDQDIYLPYDHNDYTDEDISTPAEPTYPYMSGNITAILNYNNTRLVVACGNEIWVYYPELDTWAEIEWRLWATWWKRVLNYEAWVTVVALTCTFEYLKVWAVDEWWNTKVYYYQGNNNLRSTFVYNVVDLTWVRVLHVYSINGIDYYTSSIWEYASDSLVDLNKMVWATPIKLFSQRAWMTNYDINTKAPYFVWPTSISWAYNNWHIYIADAFWVFSFKYTPNGYDKGYMKWRLRKSVITWEQVYWLCENKWMLYVSDATWCRCMRLYDTWVDGYQSEWVLISREFEWSEWGTITKMLDEIRLNFELNPLTTWNWDIDVYVSPNNLWKDTDPSNNGNDNRYHVMHITQTNAGTRTEKSNLLNDLWPNSESAFKFDWQTITYAIVISRGSETKSTPIVRQIDIRYHCKDKTNNVYDINWD